MQFVEWDWKFAIGELVSKAPTLFANTTITSNSDQRNSKKLGNAHYAGIIKSAAVILTERNRNGRNSIAHFSNLIQFTSGNTIIDSIIIIFVSCKFPLSSGLPLP